MANEIKTTEEFVNPRNSAGEYLFYEAENVFDTTVEGTVLESGFNNGMIGGHLIEE